MKIRNTCLERGRKICNILIVAVLIFSLLGCEGQKKKSKKQKISDANQPQQFDKTISELAEVVSFNPIPVKGIGLVVGLAGTGSSECPPEIRNYLRQYILAQVGQRQTIDPDALINSKETAVVFVEGFVPPGAFHQEAFDIRVSALPGTQTTSLEGGRLYTTDLKLVSRVEEIVTTSKTLALAAGTVYIDNIADNLPDQRIGYILGGGKTLEDHQISLAILTPDFRTAAILRDRINERFGRDTANAASDSMIYLSLPQDFQDRKIRFIELVRTLYVARNAASQAKQISQLVEKLQTEPAKWKYETGLEAIGKPAISSLLPLLESADIQTRFIAARCLFNIGDDRALKYLRDFAQDSSSPVRIAAIVAIGETAEKQNVISIMNRLISDDDFNTRFAAYKYLAEFKDPSVIQTAVAKDFYVDQVIQLSPKTIYVSRTDEPRIVLLGAPIDCEQNIFIEDDDSQVIINALPDEKRVSVMRKHPITGELMGPLKTTYRLVDVIRALGAEPAPDNDKERVGLGLPYSQIIELLKKMCEKGAIKAEFVPGPLTPLAQPPKKP